MLYLGLLVVSGLLPAALLLVFLRRRACIRISQVALGVVFSAVLYLPFDYLATSIGVWSFGDQFTVGKIGILPIEEYLFCIIVFPVVILLYELAGVVLFRFWQVQKRGP